jgi:predicted ArsR family transcriptional regulator
MAAPNEVRVNIRHNVLLLKTFTVPQLQAITGLNRQSIHSEVRRMKQEKLVSEVGIEKRKKGTAGGRPPVIYQLTSDPEKRFEVLQSVRAFYLAAEEQVSEPPRPESKHYFIAKEMLEEMIQKGTALTQDQKSERLDVIKKRLEYARQEEEVGEEGTQLIAASFDILEAKAIDTLAREWKSAIKLLDEARKVCQQLKANDLVTEVHSYVQTIVDRMTKEQRQFIENGMYEEAEQVVRNLDFIEYGFGDLPGIQRCVEYADLIAKMARQEWVSTQAEQRVAQQTQLFANALNQRMTVLIGQVPETVEEPRYISEPSLEPWSLPGKTRAAFAQTLLHQLLQDAEERSYGPQWSTQFADMALQLSGSVQESEG